MIAELTRDLERLHPDYTVESYDIKHVIPDGTGDLYILQNLVLKGRSKPSSCGRFDGAAIDRIMAPSCMPAAGYIIRVSRQQELVLA